LFDAAEEKEEEISRKRRSISTNSIYADQRGQNLQGRSGQGYYLALNIGKPPQAVNISNCNILLY